MDDNPLAHYWMGSQEMGSRMRIDEQVAIGQERLTLPHNYLTTHAPRDTSCAQEAYRSRARVT